MRISDVPLHDALRGHLLPLLEPKHLASLRAPCRTLKELADSRTGAIWRAAAQTIIPLESLPTHTDGNAVQGRLHLHANTVKQLTSGTADPLPITILHQLGVQMLSFRQADDPKTDRTRQAKQLSIL